MPFAFLMGVDWADCNTVGRFLGIKTFLNEFIAYLEMAPYIKNRQDMNGGPTISVRITKFKLIRALTRNVPKVSEDNPRFCRFHITELSDLGTKNF